MEKRLKKAADSLWTSKMRYVSQLCTEVWTEDNQKKNTGMNVVQKAQNKILRVLSNPIRLAGLEYASM